MVMSQDITQATLTTPTHTFETFSTFFGFNTVVIEFWCRDPGSVTHLGLHSVWLS